MTDKFIVPGRITREAYLDLLVQFEFVSGEYEDAKRELFDVCVERDRAHEHLEKLKLALRTIVNEAERSLEVIPVTNSDYDYHQGRLEAAREAMEST